MNEFERPNFDLLLSYPAHQTVPERLFVYSLILARRPKAVLEIGTLHGGGAMVIRDGLAYVGSGSLVVLDPDPQPTFYELFLNRPKQWGHGGVFFVKDKSPNGIAKAASFVHNNQFDLVVIDGDHSAGAVYQDIIGVANFLAPNAIILLHDARCEDVQKGILRAISSRRGLLDLGVMVQSDHTDNGIPWGAYHMLVFRP